MTNRTVEVTIPATAGNVAFTQAVPVGRRWKFLRLKLVVVTDATVANRIVITGFTNPAGTASKDHSVGAPNVTASLTRGVIVHSTPVASYTASANFDGVTYIATVNFDGYGFNADLFKIVVYLGVAGDSYSGSALFEESE